MTSELLRTPPFRFADLPDFPYTPQYLDVSSVIEGDGHRQIHEALMSYVVTGSGENTILCLHGLATWSFLYRKMMPILKLKGRVVAPDLLGFGRSHKFPDLDDYNFELHRDSIDKLVDTLDLRNITLLCHDWGGPIGMGVAMKYRDRIDRVVLMNTALPDGTFPMSEAFHEFRDYVAKTPDLPIGSMVNQDLNIGTEGGYTSNLSEDVLAAYDAPFPTVAYKAGVRKFPLMVPLPEDPGPTAEPLREITHELQSWNKPVFAMFGNQDPISTSGRTQLSEFFPNADEKIIPNAGHFPQEDVGKRMAQDIVGFIEKTS